MLGVKRVLARQNLQGKINIQEAKCTEEADNATAFAKETNWECLRQQRKMKEEDVEVQPVKS